VNCNCNFPSTYETTGADATKWPQFLMHTKYVDMIFLGHRLSKVTSLRTGPNLGLKQNGPIMRLVLELRRTDFQQTR
jgi:hypothetical protein